MATETTIDGYAVVMHITDYGPRDRYQVVSVHDDREMAEAALQAADNADVHPLAGIRELGHNQASRGYRLAEVVTQIDEGQELYDVAEHYCTGDIAEVLRDAGWSAKQIKHGADDDDCEALQAASDAMLATAGLIAACDSPGRGAPTVYVLRIID